MVADDRFCDGMVIIHSNRAVICSDPKCDASSYGIGAVLDRHGWFVAGTDTLGAECSICRSSPHRLTVNSP